MATQVLKDKSVKPLDLYAADEAEDEDDLIEIEEEVKNPDYNFDVDDNMDEGDENERNKEVDEEVIKRVE